MAEENIWDNKEWDNKEWLTKEIFYSSKSDSSEFNKRFFGDCNSEPRIKHFPYELLSVTNGVHPVTGEFRQYLKAGDSWRVRLNDGELDEGLAKERKKLAVDDNARLVAFIARIFPSGKREERDPENDLQFGNAIYIDTPFGQFVWFYPHSYDYLFEGLPLYTKHYEKDSTKDVYREMEKWIDRADLLREDI